MMFRMMRSFNNCIAGHRLWGMEHQTVYSMSILYTLCSMLFALCPLLYALCPMLMFLLKPSWRWPGNDKTIPGSKASNQKTPYLLHFPHLQKFAWKRWQNEMPRIPDMKPNLPKPRGGYTDQIPLKPRVWRHRHMPEPIDRDPDHCTEARQKL